MSLFSALSVSASGMSAQRARAELLVENLANSETTRTPEGGPYRRKDAVFATEAQPSQFASMFQDELGTGVNISEVVEDTREPDRRHLPGHLKQSDKVRVRLFQQRRAGLGGKPFMIYKLRTMVNDAEQRKAQLAPLNEQDGPAFKLSNDPRTTPLGRFLRQTSLDELPQFWNVLKGDMTLVGPRPLPVPESNACAAWQRRRLYVTPGITCIWQIYGRSRVSFSEWIRMDLRYIREQRLIEDVKILLLTVPAVLMRRGAR